MPVLHVNMLFSTSCWSTDTHLLPYIVYKHTGADSVWYAMLCMDSMHVTRQHVAQKWLQHCDYRVISVTGTASHTVRKRNSG